MVYKTLRFLIVLFNISLYFAVSYSYAQNTTINPNGYNIFYYPNGIKSSEGNMKNGKPDGYWKNYSEQGIIKSEGNRKNGAIDSTWKFYNEKGQITTEYTYNAGKKNGERKIYNIEENRVAVIENYVNDIKNGNTFELNKEGKITKFTPFEKGKENGVGKEFNKDSLVITITNYKGGYIFKEEKINRIDKFGKKQKIWKYFYEDGEKVKREESYKDDKLDGYVKEFTQDGNLIKTEKYINGKLQKNAKELVKFDIKKDFYEDGKIKSSGTVNKNGVLEGVTRIYSPEGKIINSKIYVDGLLTAEGIYDERGFQQGKWKEFYPSGDTRAEGEYMDGKKTGEWIYYHENGKIEQKGKYLKGEKPNGEWRWYYDNGQLLREEIYEKGIPEGKIIEYNDTGKVVTKGQYYEGERDGIWILEDGDQRDEGNYKNGERDGKWKSIFVSKSKTAFEGAFVDGNENGKHIYYYDNGQIKEEGNYIMGNREGTWKFYDYEGLPVWVKVYEGGVEKKIDGASLE